jgi:hypothetical protein
MVSQFYQLAPATLVRFAEAVELPPDPVEFT